MLINNAKFLAFLSCSWLIIPTVLACCVYMACKVEGLNGTKGENPKYNRVYSEGEGINESNKIKHTHTTKKSRNMNYQMKLLKGGLYASLNF